jgi:hypothetical protein
MLIESNAYMSNNWTIAYTIWEWIYTYEQKSANLYSVIEFQPFAFLCIGQFKLRNCWHGCEMGVDWDWCPLPGGWGRRDWMFPVGTLTLRFLFREATKDGEKWNNLVNKIQKIHAATNCIYVFIWNAERTNCFCSFSIKIFYLAIKKESHFGEN